MKRLKTRSEGFFVIKSFRAHNITRRMLAVCFSILTLVTMAGALVLNPFVTVAAVDAPPAIDNYKQEEDGFPLTPGTPLQNSSKNSWRQDYGADKLKNYDAVYTREASLLHNKPGFGALPTVQHLVQEGNMGIRATFRFFGYSSGEHLDWHYEDKALQEAIHVTWTFRPINMDFDIIKETGVLFNGAKPSPAAPYTGYAIVIMKNPASAPPNKIQMWLCWIGGCKLDDPGSQLSGALEKKVLLVDDIPNQSTEVYEMRIARNAATGQFYIYVNEHLAAAVGNPLNGDSSNNLTSNSVLGFGPFTHYRPVSEVEKLAPGKVSGSGNNKTVNQLAIMEIEDVVIYDEDVFRPIPTYATVKFLDINDKGKPLDSVTPLANDQSRPITNIPAILNTTTGQYALYWGYAGRDYKVMPPPRITDEFGVVWTLVEASRDVLDPITYDANPGNNLTILYYDAKVNLDKNASVNGGPVRNGTAANPVAVETGDTVHYYLDLLNPRANQLAPGYGTNPGGGTEGPPPIVIPPPEEYIPPKFIRVWNSDTLAVAKTADGKLYGWGYNAYGQLGLGDTNNRKRPAEITYFADNGIHIAEVWAFSNCAYAGDDMGNLYSWGRNNYGQLGCGNVADQPVPVKVTGAKNIVDLWSENDFVLARDADGKLFGWGYNSYGMAGSGTTSSQNSPIEITDSGNATVGDPAYNALFGMNVSGFDVYLTNYNVYLREPSGSLYGWGYNSAGSVGNNTATTQTRPLKITGWGDSDTNPFFGQNVVEFYAGSNYTAAARTADNRVFTWGGNSYGQAGNGTRTSQRVPLDLTALPGCELFGKTITGLWATGDGATLIARDSKNQYYGWGYNDYCQAGQNYTAAKQAQWDSGFDADGNAIEKAEYNNNVNNWNGFIHRVLVPSPIAGLAGKDLVKVWPSNAYGYFIAKDGGGKLWGWGQGGYYHTGLGSSANHYNPQEITAAAGTNALFGNYAVTDIWELSSYHGVIARDAGGLYYGWGYNTNGQLGLGDFNTRSLPQLLADVNTLGFGLFAGNLNRTGNWLIALDSAGEAYTWGENNYGQLGLGYWGAGQDARRNVPTWIGTYIPGTDEYTGDAPVLARVWPGDDYMIAVDEYGRFWGWGNNSSGQLGIGNTINRANPAPIPLLQDLEPVNIWTGPAFVLARGANGKYYSWGSNSSGNLGRSVSSVPNTKPGEVVFPSGTIITDVYMGSSTVYAKSSEGKLFVWGSNTYGQHGTGNSTTYATQTPTEITGWQNCQINEGGTYNQVLVTHVNPLFHKEINEVWVGSGFCLAKTSEGKLYSWGNNSFGQCGLGYANASYYQEGVNTTTGVWVPQEVTGWGVPSENPLAGATVTSIWLNNRDSSVFAKTSGGNLFSWGSNTGGQLGVGDTTRREAATEVILPAGTDITEMWRGYNTVFALDSDGKYWAWGSNDSGQLGMGNTNNVHAPSQGTGLNGHPVTGLKVGYNSVIFKVDGGDYYGFGTNTGAVLGLGHSSATPFPTLLPMKSLGITDLWMNATSSAFVIACKGNGDAYVWGTNNNCQLAIRDNTTNQTAPQMNPAYRFKDGVIVVAPDPEGFFTVTDLLPLGMELVMNGSVPWYAVTNLATPPADVSGTLGDLVVKVTQEGGRQRVTFFFTVLPKGITRFHIQVTVKETGRFTNNSIFKGFMSNGDPDAPVSSNETHHKVGARQVTEYYRAARPDSDPYANAAQAIASDPLRGNTVVPFDVADDGPYDYAPNYYNSNVPLAGFSSNGSYWYYIGYQRVGKDSTIVRAPPPTGHESPPEWCWTNQTVNNEIIFFYMPNVLIQVEFRDYNHPSVELKPTMNVTVPPTGDYTMPESYMDPFVLGVAAGINEGQWGYAGGYWLSTYPASPSILGNLTAPQTPPKPTFTAAELQGSPLTKGVPVRRIVLYFTTTLTVNYMEYKPTADGRQNGAVLYYEGEHSYVDLVISGLFDTRVDYITGAIRNGVTSLADVPFKTYRGYSIDGGKTMVFAPPPNFFSIQVPPGATLTLYFSTTYVIAEKFHDRDGNPVPPEDPLDDIKTTVNSGDPWTGTPKSIPGWFYLGYRIGTDDDYLRPSMPPKPTFPEVSGNEIIIYVYGRREVDDPAVQKAAQVRGNGEGSWAPNAPWFGSPINQPPGANLGNANGAEGFPYEVFDEDLIKYTIRVSNLPSDPRMYIPMASYGYSTSAQTFRAEAEGDYRIEAWGGDSGAAKGDYARGTIHLTAGQTLTLYVGGANAISEVRFGGSTVLLAANNSGASTVSGTLSFALTGKMGSANFKSNPNPGAAPGTGYAVVSLADPDPFLVTILDIIPVGLEYVDSEPRADNHAELREVMELIGESGGKYTAVSQPEWSLTYTGNAQRSLEVTVTVRVKDKGDFVNSASAAAYGAPGTSNPTYHRNYAFYTLTERYVKNDDRNFELREPFVNTDIKQDSEFVTPTAPENHKFLLLNGTDNFRYRYVGYMVGDEVHLGSAWPGDPGNTVTVIHDDMVITYLYEEIPVFILHIRQIVIDPLSGLARPVMGYYILHNNGKALPLTSDSVSPEYPFTDYNLIPNDDKVYLLTDIVPQYYELMGHVQNSGELETPVPDGHPTARPLTGLITTAAAPNGEITLDYRETGEIWITLYITPKGRPGNQQTAVETNKFGEVYRKKTLT